MILAWGPDLLQGGDQLEQDRVGDVVADQVTVSERLQTQAGVLVVDGLSPDGVGGSHPAVP